MKLRRLKKGEIIQKGDLVDAPNVTNDLENVPILWIGQEYKDAVKLIRATNLPLDNKEKDEIIKGLAAKLVKHSKTLVEQKKALEAARLRMRRLITYVEENEKASLLTIKNYLQETLEVIR